MEGRDSLTGPAAQSRNVVQLLALFLLLLSFFILLNSLSSFEAERAKAVLQSLNRTFAGETSQSPARPYVAVRDQPALERFRNAIRAALLTALAPQDLAVSAGGGLIQATLSADDLFVPGSAELRDNRAPLLKGIAQALAARPADLRFEAELVLSVAPEESALARDRAGSFARRPVAFGAPADAVAIGLGGGTPGTAWLRFAARNPDDGALSFAPPATEGDRHE